MLSGRSFRRWLSIAAIALLAIGLISFTIHSLFPSTTISTLQLGFASATQRLTTPKAANATIGVGAVYVIPSAEQKQRDRLLETANLTEVELTVLGLPAPKKSEVKALRKAHEGQMSETQAKIWLRQVNALKHFQTTAEHDTALFLAGDVDWTSDLRSSQVPVAAATVRKITADQVGFASQIMDQFELLSYWGVRDSWDVLNLGDCGELTGDPNWKASVPRLALPDRNLWRRGTDSLSVGVSLVPEQLETRLARRDDPPLCATGYAVTQTSVRRLLDLLESKDRKQGEQGAGSKAQSYDERITEICRESLLRCLSISPRLIHRIDT